MQDRIATPAGSNGCLHREWCCQRYIRIRHGHWALTPLFIVCVHRTRFRDGAECVNRTVHGPCPAKASLPRVRLIDICGQVSLETAKLDMNREQGLYSMRQTGKLFTGRASPELAAKRVCDYLQIPMGRGPHRAIPDGENLIVIKVEEDVRGRTVLSWRQRCASGECAI